MEQLNIDGLRELARQRELDIRGMRAIILDRLVDHFERSGWPEQIIIAAPNIDDGSAINEELPITGENGIQASAARRVEPILGQQIRNLNYQNFSSFEMNEIMQAVMRTLESNNQFQRQEPLENR
ncbi:hypothetical protein EUZ93_01515 [Wolbachia pipientis]|nr:hypothetical protein [Wolbachia pipientis]